MFEQIELELGLEPVNTGFNYSPTQVEEVVNHTNKWTKQASKELLVNHLIKEVLKGKILEFKETIAKHLSGWEEIELDGDYFLQTGSNRQRSSVDYKSQHFIGTSHEIIYTHIEGVNYKYQITVKSKTDTQVYDVHMGAVKLNGVPITKTELEFTEM